MYTRANLIYIYIPCNQDQTRPDKSEQEYQDKSEEQDQQQPDTKLDELNLAIRKLQLWEFALQRRFGDRFKNAPHKLAAHPLWQKVQKFSSFHRFIIENCCIFSKRLKLMLEILKVR